MDAIVNYFNSLGLDFWVLAKAGLVLLLGTFLISIFGRFVFGKRSALNNAVSSAIGILFIYAVTVVIKSAGAQFQALLAPLPFVTITEDNLFIFSFLNADFPLICSEVLNMVILAFLVNLADRWLPNGKKLLSWLFFRCLTVLLGLVMHLAVVWLFRTYLPFEIQHYAPIILLGMLVILLLTGVLKIVIGALLTTVNPLIAALYTFFFASVVGKQITKAVLTTFLLSMLVLGLNYLGCAVISVATAALMAYIPFVIILIVLWFIVGHIL